MDIDMDTKKVIVTSSLPANEIMESLKKTGKEVTHLGSKAA